MVNPLVEFAPGFLAHAGGEEEARFYYKEIFEDETYNVAALPDDAFIVDAGANVGFFSIYMRKKYPRATILAFEPAPNTFEDLRANVKLHGVEDGVELNQCALGSEETTQPFTFFPNFPGNSTLVPREKELLTKTAYELRHDLGEGCDRMYRDAETIPVPIRPLSRFLRGRADLESIDLLKVDVEGVELETLRGLDDAHLALVRNVVVEICDLMGGRLDALEKFLRVKGFVVRTEVPDWIPREGKMFMVIGQRESAAAR